MGMSSVDATGESERGGSLGNAGSDVEGEEEVVVVECEVVVGGS